MYYICFFKYKDGDSVVQLSQEFVYLKGGRGIKYELLLTTKVLTIITDDNKESIVNFIFSMFASLKITFNLFWSWKCWSVVAFCQIKWNTIINFLNKKAQVSIYKNMSINSTVDLVKHFKLLIKNVICLVSVMMKFYRFFIRLHCLITNVPHNHNKVGNHCTVLEKFNWSQLSEQIMVSIYYFSQC
jgi:hypothetical protein